MKRYGCLRKRCWTSLPAKVSTLVDALKIDVEGLEDVILAPFFRDAPPRLWPRFVIIEDSRPSWKVDLMSVMQGCGYELVALSRHKNLMLRLKP